MTLTGKNSKCNIILFEKVRSLKCSSILHHVLISLFLNKIDIFLVYCSFIYNKKLLIIHVRTIFHCIIAI